MVLAEATAFKASKRDPGQAGANLPSSFSAPRLIWNLPWMLRVGRSLPTPTAASHPLHGSGCRGRRGQDASSIPWSLWQLASSEQHSGQPALPASACRGCSQTSCGRGGDDRDVPTLHWRRKKQPPLKGKPAGCLCLVRNLTQGEAGSRFFV